MKHDTAIPLHLHTDMSADVKEALGAFWSTIFKDQELVDATVSARVLSACQAYIDMMEALSLRDHSGMPVFHREHWHPVLIRLSERNTGCGLTVGMEGDPKIGEQPAGSIFQEGEVFVVGGNAAFSKVNTYPLDASVRKSLRAVGTCLCDSIAVPEHMLMHGRDFMLRDGVLLIRKEHDPFTAGGYRVFEDGADHIAVLWLCDAEFDRNHVGDFLAYPLGFDVKSTQASARMLSALWDVIIYGLTPRHLNILLGALFGVPVLGGDSVVERVDTSGGIDTVITDTAVYQVPTARKAAYVAAGARLAAGAFLTDEITVYHGLSQQEFLDLVEKGRLPSLTLPPGSIAGVDAEVTLANTNRSLSNGPSGNYEWFKLNADDSRSSPFWTAVFARTTAAERTAFCTQLAGGGTTVNPLKALGYSALANTVLVYTDRAPLSDMCAAYALDMLRELMPAAGAVQIIQTVAIAESASVEFTAQSMSARGAAAVAMSDDVTCDLQASACAASSMCEASDDVVVRFIPDPITEV